MTQTGEPGRTHTVSAGALSVIPENFAKAMVVHAVRRNVKKSWVNDRDQFLQPSHEPQQNFVNQCVVWSLFSNSNQTASIRNVHYRARTYQIDNHFFPFQVAEVRQWKISDSDIVRSMDRDPLDRFIATWLGAARLDNKCEELLNVGRVIYLFFFEHFRELPTSELKVEHWDAGWYQIKRCLDGNSEIESAFAELDALKVAIADEIREQVLELGILTAT